MFSLQYFPDCRTGIVSWVAGSQYMLYELIPAEKLILTHFESVLVTVTREEEWKGEYDWSEFDVIKINLLSHLTPLLSKI